MLKEAFAEIFPGKDFPKFNQVIYSPRIKSYNAYATLRNSEITIRLSRNYESVNKNVVIGVIQNLLSRMYKKRIVTRSMEEADVFLKEQRSAYKPRIENHVPQELEESFVRVNNYYFAGSLLMPVINWGRKSYRRLGQFIESANLIRISRALETSPSYALDYIMYHEMLHLQRDKGRKRFAKAHTKEFKELEESFKQANEAKEWIRKNLSRRRF